MSEEKTEFRCGGGLFNMLGGLQVDITDAKDELCQYRKILNAILNLLNETCRDKESTSIKCIYLTFKEISYNYKWNCS